MKMVVNQGGRCAEIVLFGREKLTDGCLGDLTQISRVMFHFFWTLFVAFLTWFISLLCFMKKIAREMAVSVMNPKFGLPNITFLDNLEIGENKSSLPQKVQEKNPFISSFLEL